MDTTGTFEIAAHSIVQASTALHKYSRSTTMSLSSRRWNGRARRSIRWGSPLPTRKSSRRSRRVPRREESLRSATSASTSPRLYRELRPLRQEVRERHPELVIRRATSSPANDRGADPVGCRHRESRDRSGLGVHDAQDDRRRLSAALRDHRCADAAHGLEGHICADGGCATVGDIAKAFGGGADFVMLAACSPGTRNRAATRSCATGRSSGASTG